VSGLDPFRSFPVVLGEYDGMNSRHRFVARA